MNWARAPQVACIAGALVLFACSGQPGPGSAQVFSADLPVSDQTPGIWEQTLPAGTYLVGARESDLDFRMTLELQGRRTAFAEEIPRHGYQATVIALGEPTRVRVEIHNADFREWKGRARLSIVRLRDVERPPDDRELGFVSFGMGVMRLALPTYAERETSIESFREAIRHFTAANDMASRAEAHKALAFTEYSLRLDNAATVIAAEQARADFEAAGDALGVHDAIALRGMADIEIAQKMNAAHKRAEQRTLYRTADERLRFAGEFFGRQGLNLRRDYAMNVRGIGFLYAGDYESAAPIFEEVIRRAIAIHDTKERVKATSNYGWTLNRLGLFAQAIRSYREILPLAARNRDRDPTLYAAVLGNYGLTAVAMGDFDSALAAQTESHAVFVEHGMRAEAANALSSIGGIYLRIGDTERARRTLDLAIADFEVAQDFSGLASAARLAGSAAASLGRHHEALAYLRRALAVDGKPVDMGRTHVLIARMLRELGDLRGAGRELEHALKIDNALLQASAVHERGRLRLARGQGQRAIADFREADASFAALGADLSRIDINTALSGALLARGESAEAAAVADVAIVLENGIRVKSANPEWRASFLSMSYSPYEARIAAELSGHERNPLNIWRAFKIAERVRARVTAARSTDPGTKNAGERKEIETLRAKLTAQLGRLESRLQRSGPEDATAIELRRVAEVTRAEMMGLAARGAAAVDAPAMPESLTDLQALLPPDLAVLAFFTGDRSTHAWLLTHDDLRHRRAPGAAALGPEVDAFVGELRKSPAGRPGGRLSTTLLGNLLRDVLAKRLVILADGPLNALPFAALPVPGAEGQLVDRFVISMSSSLAFALPPVAADAPAIRPTRVAIVSDPVYSTADRRLMSSEPETSSRLRDSLPLARLAYSAIEARSVSLAFDAGETIELSGFDATPAKVLDLESEPLRVLHFATHARGSDAPEDSALLLTRFQADGSPLPRNALTSEDVAHSHLWAELVVLSGCATGEGRELRGGGVLGLTHEFLANGSRSVIASLWPIEDAPTARFMQEFYTAYRKSGRAAEALRIAQLRTRNGPANAVWSSFVVRANELP